MSERVEFRAWMQRLAEEGRENGYVGLDFPIAVDIIHKMYPGETIFDDSLFFELGDPIVGWAVPDEEENV